jgi:hypothetical protein
MQGSRFVRVTFSVRLVSYQEVMSMTYTWIEIINGMLAAGREHDRVAMKFWQDLWDETEIDYADTLDMIGI